MSLELRAKLMQIVAMGFLLFSIMWALAPYTSINLPSRFLLDLLDWPLNNLSAELSRDVMWLSSIGAGLLVAFSIFLYGIVAPAIKTYDKSIINVSKLAIIAWYIVDSVGSIASGVLSNAIFNTVFFIMVMIPLIGIKK
ncbi:MAG: hypothetical protein AB8B80_11890 [Marinicellaceae bacterium]